MTNFRADIQGLRALAVASVVIHHAFPSFLPGGFLGVDIFFVISGYLITGIILRDIDAGRFTIAEFYRRRIRRIFPALFVVLAACAAAGYLLMTPGQFEELGRTTVATVLFFSNIEFFRLTDYFGGPADLKPLLHTWSLSVEEQFYILFPVLMVWISAKYRRFRTIGVLVLLGLSLACAEILRLYSPSAAFFLAPSRAFELLLGALLALNVFPSLPDARYRSVVSIVGIAAIIVSMVVFNPEWPLPGLLSLLPCLGTAMVIQAGGEGSNLGSRLIAIRPAVSIGNISYSLYLWHWPILAFALLAKGSELSAIEAGLAVLLSIILAYASYRWVEKPFLTPQARRYPAIRLGLAMLLVGVALGQLLLRTDGLPQRFSPEARKAFAAAGDVNRRRRECHNGFLEIIPYVRNCVFGAEGIRPSIAVWGDSHGTELVVALGEIEAQAGRSVMQITASQCPPAIGFRTGSTPYCIRHNEETLAGLIADPDVRTVILAINAGAEAYRPNDGALQLMHGTEEAVQALRKAGKQVVLLQPIPLMDRDPPEEVGLAIELGKPLDRIGLPRERFETLSATWKAFVKDLGNRSGAIVIDPAELLCDESLCRVHSAEHGILYFNASHLSVSGARLLAERLKTNLW